MQDFNLFSKKSALIWSIHLEDSKNKTWVENDEFSILTYSWRDEDIRNLLNQINLPDENIISSLESGDISFLMNSYGVINFINFVRDGDRIVGIKNDLIIEKIGIVVKVNYDIVAENRIEVILQWEKEFVPIHTIRDHFEKNKDFQIIRNRNLKTSVPNDKRFIFNHFLPENSEIKLNRNQLKKIALWFGIRSDLLENEGFSVGFVYVPPKRTYNIKKTKLSNYDDNIVELFYGTNRNSICNSKNLNKKYGYELKPLRFGLCKVSIPINHKQGKLEKPTILRFEISDNPEKHFMLRSIEEYDENTFLEKMNISLDKADSKEGLIFIHGFNATFADAAKRTAQIVKDISFQGISGFFSWPSAGGFRGYLHDEKKVDCSNKDFNKFVQLILENTNIQKLHLIAHSMGNKLMTFSLTELSKDINLSEHLEKIHQIILGAPDIDQTEFKRNILPEFQNIGKRRTIYASENDKALGLSQILRMGEPRLGDGGNDMFVENGIDTIDSSYVESSFIDHTYIFDSKELIYDIIKLIKGESPQNRNLIMKEWKNQSHYWIFAD